MTFTTMLVVITLVVALTDGLMGQPHFGFGGFSSEIPVIQVAQSSVSPGYLQIDIPPTSSIPLFDYNQYEQSFKRYNPSFLLPDMDTMKNIVPKKGGTYDGTYVATASDSNGQGILEIMLNHNGKTFYKTIVQPGNAQKDPEDFPKPKKTMFNTFEFGGFHEFIYPEVKPFRVEPPDLDTMRHYVPEKGETVQMTSHRTHHSYSNINGNIKSEGGVADLVNKNGKVKETVTVYKTNP